MTDSTTTPQRVHLLHRQGIDPKPDAKHDVWVTRTEALIANFEEATPEQVSPALGFVIIAADFLWAEHGAQASFGALDPFALAEACSELIGNEDTLRSFCSVLRAFYQFLGARNLVDPDARERILDDLQALETELAPVRGS